MSLAKHINYEETLLRKKHDMQLREKENQFKIRLQPPTYFFMLNKLSNRTSVWHNEAQ